MIKKQKEKVAIIDWDGTIRHGFTIVDWMEYLYKHKIVGSHHIYKLKSYFQQYSDGDLSHDELAEITGNLYAKALRGKSYEKIRMLAEKYIRIDKKKLFKEMVSLLENLKSINIKIVIISGAPLEVLEQYAVILDFHKVYALKIDRDESGIYTGKVEENPGISVIKGKIIEGLRKQYIIIYGFGNSESDVPIFKSAKQPILINIDSSSEHLIKYRHLHNLLIINPYSGNMIEKISEKIERRKGDGRA